MVINMGNVIYIDVLIVLNIFINYFLLLATTFFLHQKPKRWRLVVSAVVGSLFSFPVFGSKCAPVQHLVNVLCAVTVGPWWALAQAFIASLIRNLLGLGSPLAFPGSMCGALLGGLLYKYGKKLPFAYLGEVAGTGIIGGMLSYPVAYLVMGNKAAALFTFVVPFLISTCGGTLIAIIITLPLKKSGLLGRMKESLEE